MKKAKYIVKLSNEDKNFIERSLKAGTDKARKLSRCRILLLADEGKNNIEIAKLLKLSTVCIIAIKKRYIQEGLDKAINERARPGAPSKFTGKQKAKITAIACSNPPKGHSRWTLRLLANHIVSLDLVDSVSFKTVERILKKTN